VTGIYIIQQAEHGRTDRFWGLEDDGVGAMAIVAPSSSRRRCGYGGPSNTRLFEGAIHFFEPGIWTAFDGEPAANDGSQGPRLPLL
jgi:hypothetical protein